MRRFSDDEHDEHDEHDEYHDDHDDEYHPLASAPLHPGRDERSPRRGRLARRVEPCASIAPRVASRM